MGVVLYAPSLALNQGTTTILLFAQTFLHTSQIGDIFFFHIFFFYLNK